jgi:hypothetical protein
MRFECRGWCSLFLVVAILTAGRSSLAEAATAMRVVTDWGQGFEAEVTVENPAEQPVRDWRLEFELDRRITQIWNATLAAQTSLGAGRFRYTIAAPPWNDAVPARGRVSFGFLGEAGDLRQVPTEFALRSAGGATPTPRPSATAAWPATPQAAAKTKPPNP